MEEKKSVIVTLSEYKVEVAKEEKELKGELKDLALVREIKPMEHQQI